MSKKTQTAQAADVEILSLKDGAYKQAAGADTVTDFAHYVIEKCKGFGTPDYKLTDEAKTELYDGYRLRYAQKSKRPIVYAVISGDYYEFDKLTPDQKDKVKEKIEMSVDVAFSYTSNEFGKLANDRPQYHKLVGEWRAATSTYCSNRFRDLTKEAKRILSGDKKGTRKPNLSFAETIDKTMESLKTKLAKCVTTKSDNTADQVKFNKALGAFLAVWKA
jgi:hypothetical protein